VRIRGFFNRHLRNPTEKLSENDRKIAVRYSDRYPEEALREFHEVIRRFPESEQARLSRKIIEEIRELQAVRLMELGNFYLFYGKMESARHYYQRLLQEFPTSERVKQAQQQLDRMIEQ
jgi:outer membrane protein assembly factor BamD (BamD/ComL family)